MLFLLTITVFVLILGIYLKKITYWMRNGVPQGSLWYSIKENTTMMLQKRCFSDSIKQHYRKFPESRYSGYFNFLIPILIVKDPDLLKELTVKNFDYFPNHRTFIPESNEPLWARNLFAIKDQKWKQMRPILSPSFTSSKMRILFQLFTECAINFRNFFMSKNEDVIEVELKDAFTRFTNDVIASAAFGIKIDSLQNPQNEFYEMGKRITNFGSGILTMIKFFFILMFPKLVEATNVNLFDKDTTDYFVNIIEEALKLRKEKGIVRPDMIHLLLEAQKELENTEELAKNGNLDKQNEKELTNIDIAAQALIFFFAGFESVSTLMCFMAYELAINPDIQDKLRNEIISNSNQGTITYESLLAMKYMDQIVSESLRKWPPNFIVDRECAKSYTIEPRLSNELPVHLKPKDVIWIPVYGIHHDPEIYPEPDKFDPERFNEQNKSKINPYSYVPFGLGPRNCIGSRFALLEVKTVFFYMLQEFEIIPIKKSVIPLKLSPKTFNLSAEDGLWFGFKKLNK